ncbi:major histocompatibility complex class I-related gene protein-like [Engraulis encrasicolus]|uniref:major histocompatibility complex class I-related gene protein-like n=1 Tax=Engraulis encrasicolus TaxID=184585 RepID=UPI002FD02F1A
MLAVVFLLTFVSLSSAATHSLQYLYSASSGIPGLPEYISVGEVDGVVISYYDSNIKREVSRQSWMAENLDEEYWISETELDKYHEVIFKENINILRKRFNQDNGIAVFQKMYGCQWDDETNATDSFEAFGYNGEDFMSLDPKNMTWIASIQQAENTAYRWNRMEKSLPHRKAYFQKDCADWLKKYVSFVSKQMSMKVPPEVFLGLSHPWTYRQHICVLCHATGFYPKEVNITWKRDGVELQDGVNMGETLPNGDGTFQKRATMTVSPEERWKHQYSCEVTHKSGKPIVLDHEEDHLSIIEVV